MAAPGANETVIVVTGGDPVCPDALGLVPAHALVIAADSGIEQAQALGLRIDVAVGDFDSVDPEALRAVEASGARIERHPAAKDATDLELALDAARLHGARRVHVVGGHGGRLDHLLANALLVAAPAYADLQVVAHMGEATVSVVRSATVLFGPPGDLVTLLAVGGPATGVTTEGLLYPLRGEELHPGSSRGVSNELVDRHATVQIDAGVLLAVQPGQPGAHHLQRTAL